MDILYNQTNIALCALLPMFTFGSISQPDEDDHVLNLQFSWNGLVKPVGSCFIGVSPEFEVALFTIVFFLSNERVTKVTVKVDEYLLEIVVYRFGRSIGTSYPKMISSNNKDF